MLLRAHPALVARASVAATVLIGSTFCSADGPSEGRRVVAEVIVLNDNGAWSWFEDERAVVDPVRGTLVVSSVADASGTGGMTRDGNVEVVTHDLATGDTRRTVLHAHLQDDDHNSAALYVRRDGGYVAMYAKHAADTLTRWRVSGRSGDQRDVGAGAHARSWRRGDVLQRVPGRRWRAALRVRPRAGRDPHLLVSDDEGVSWRPGGRLLDGPGRPYVRYAADHPGRIHLLDHRATPTRRADEHLPRHHRRPAPASIRRHGRRPRPVRRRRRPTGASHDGVRGRRRGPSMDGRPPGRRRRPAIRRLLRSRGRANEYWYARFDGGIVAHALPGARRQCAVSAASRTTPASSRSTPAIRAASSSRPTFIPKPACR